MIRFRDCKLSNGVEHLRGRTYTHLVTLLVDAKILLGLFNRAPGNLDVLIGILPASSDSYLLSSGGPVISLFAAVIS